MLTRCDKMPHVESNSRITDVLGYVLLASAILLHAWFFVFVNQSSYPELLSVARNTGSFEEFCKMLSFIDKCDNTYIYTWVLASTPQYLIPVYQVLVIALVFVLALRVFGSPATAGLASFMYAVAPGSLVIYTVDRTGLALVGLLATVSAITMTYGLIGELKALYLMIGVILYVLLIGYYAVPSVLLMVSMFLLVDYVRGRVTVKPGVVIGVIAALTLIFYFINGSGYYGLYALPALTLAIGVVAALFLDKRYESLSTHRLLYASILLIAALTLGSLTLRTGSYKFTQVIAPSIIHIYGLPGLLAIAGVILAFTTSRFTYYNQLIALTITALLVNLFDFSIISLSLVYLVLTSCIFMDYVFKAFKELRFTNWKFKLSALTVLVGLTAASFAGSFLTFGRETSYGMVFNEIGRLEADKGFTGVNVYLASLSDELGRVVKSTARSSNVLVVSHWDYSYFLQSALIDHGIKAYSITHSYGGGAGKSLLSSIMVSNWETSKLMLKNISSELGVQDVYILVAFAYSVGYGNTSFIGAPATITLQNYQYPLLVFDAYGDLFNVFEYLAYSNKTIVDYLYAYNERPRMMALLWTSSNGWNMLIAQLSLKALKDSGFNEVYNYVISQSPLNYTVTGFDLVYSKSIELGRLSIAYYGDYTVYYMVALFKLTS